MKCGVPPTALNARTGELTPPGMTRLSARAKSFADSAEASFTMSARPRGFAREISDDHVRAGAANRGQRFHHRALLVDPAVPRGGLDHRVLAAHLIRGRRIRRTAP